MTPPDRPANGLAGVDPTQPAGPGSEAAPPAAKPAPRLSDWITYTRPCGCCGPIGDDGPIRSELYVRTGPAFLLATDFLSRALQSGWAVQGGGRTLFFNSAGDAAWTGDLSISFMFNHGNGDVMFEFSGREVSARALYRTYVNAGFGREWYLHGNAKACGGWFWRAGADIGGRYGAERLDINDDPNFLGFARRNDTVAGLYLSAHTDLELPCGCCTWVYGLRLEWDYTWSDMLLQPSGKLSDLQDINLLINLGVRF
jgi:hypothetical protein